MRIDVALSGAPAWSRARTHTVPWDDPDQPDTIEVHRAWSPSAAGTLFIGRILSRAPVALGVALTLGGGARAQYFTARSDGAMLWQVGPELVVARPDGVGWYGYLRAGLGRADQHRTFGFGLGAGYAFGIDPNLTLGIGPELVGFRTAFSERSDFNDYQMRTDWLWPGLSLRLGLLRRP